jgi:hypothetical protein
MMAPMKALPIGVAVAFLLCACYGAPSASPTPGGMGEVLPALALRGATVGLVVSGDAGCTSSALHSNAARIELTVAGDETRYTVYLFRWRRPADFESASQPFAACVDDFVAQSEGEVPVDGVEVAPWRAYGPGWSEELHSLLEDALGNVGYR